MYINRLTQKAREAAIDGLAQRGVDRRLILAVQRVGGLPGLAEAAGPAFHRGVVLYTGDTVVPFAAKLHAVPVSALWPFGA